MFEFYQIRILSLSVLNFTKFGSWLCLFWICLLRLNWPHVVSQLDPMKSAYLGCLLWYVLTNIYTCGTLIKTIKRIQQPQEFSMFQTNHFFLLFMPPAPLPSPPVKSDLIHCSLVCIFYMAAVLTSVFLLGEVSTQIICLFFIQGLVSYWVLRAPDVFQVGLFYQPYDFQAFPHSLGLTFSS